VEVRFDHVRAGNSAKRLNDAQLAIDAIIRGLELDQISFACDGVLPRAVSAAHARWPMLRVRRVAPLRLEIC